MDRRDNSPQIGKYDRRDDSPTIGSQTKPAETMRRTEGWTRIQPPKLSRIGGLLKTDQEQPRGTGMLPSERGADGTPARMGRWVSQQLGPFQLPEETVHSMSNSLVSHLVVRTEPVIGTDGQFERTRLASFQIRLGMNRVDAEHDLFTLRGVLYPADKAAVVPIMARLKARTKSGHADASEAAFVAEVMVDDLAKYPIDVVDWACEYWTTGGAESKWFPSWPELKDLCERRCAPRRRLAKALQWVVDGEPDTDDWKRQESRS